MFDKKFASYQTNWEKIDLSWRKYKEGSMGAKNCPVCGEDYEFYEETMGDDKGIQIMHDIDQMWEVEENIRWNRICHRVGAKSSANTEGIQLAVETFRHHHGETE